jgi:phospholipid/cholesterol/gamma-HCH transport system ATP-binding protein
MNAAAIEPAAAVEGAGPPLLRVERLGVRFGRHEVLRDISIDLAPGDTLVVLGESGCGKTVLLKSMIGLVRPSAGDVLFEGRSLPRMNDRQLAHLRTRYGFVFQGAALFDSLTIAENIAFPLREHTRIPAAEIRRITESLVAEVGCRARCSPRSPSRFPGGCGSGLGWPARWPSIRISCSTTSRPRASIRS